MLESEYLEVLSEYQQLIGDKDTVKIGKELINLEKCLPDNFLIDLADELCNFPEDIWFPDKNDPIIKYVADRYSLGLYIYRNLVDNLPEDRKTFCALLETEFDPMYSTWNYIIEN